MEGIEPRASRIWQDTANSEMRIWLLEELVKLGVGLNDVEAFNIGLINKLRKIEEDEDKNEELDAKSRQVYDPLSGVYDDRKRRVTDLVECNRVFLPNH